MAAEVPNIKLDLNIDFGKEADQYKTVEARRKFWLGIFSNAVNRANPQGLGKEFLRRYRDITEKLRSLGAAPGQAGTGDPSTLTPLSLTQHEFGFFKASFEHSTWEPGTAAILCQIFDILDGATPK